MLTKDKCTIYLNMMYPAHSTLKTVLPTTPCRPTQTRMLVPRDAAISSAPANGANGTFPWDANKSFENTLETFAIAELSNNIGPLIKRPNARPKRHGSHSKSFASFKTREVDSWRAEQQPHWTHLKMTRKISHPFRDLCGMKFLKTKPCPKSAKPCARAHDRYASSWGEALLYNYLFFLFSGLGERPTVTKNTIFENRHRV